MIKKESNKKALVKGTVLYAIGNLGTKIISFLIVPLYTYYISTGDMGDYDILMSTVSLLTPLITLRVSDAAYRWMLHSSDNNKNCISATYRVLAFSSLTALVVTILIGDFVALPYYGYFISLLILGRWLESLQTLLRGLQKQGLFAASGILYTLIYLIYNFWQIVIMHHGIEAMMQGTLISDIITIALIITVTPELRVRIIRTKDNRKLTAEMLKYSAPLVPSALSWWVMGASDRYIIRFILGRDATGIYAVANKFPTIISTLFTIFNLSWTDVAIGKLNEGKETVDYSSRIFKQLYELSFGFTLALIPLTKIVTNYILADSYKSASVYIGFLYLGAIFQGFTAFISAGILQGTKTNTIAVSSTFGAIANAVVDLALMNTIGIHAASISTFIGFFVMWLIRMHDAKKISPVNVHKVHFSVYLVASIIMATASIWTTTVADMALTIIFGVLFLVSNRKLISSLIKRISHR